MQHQNIDNSNINDSDVRLGNAGGDLIQGDGNSITKIYVDLVGQKQRQWSDRQSRILKRVQEDVEQRLEFTLNDDEVLIPLRLRDEGKGVSRASLRLRRKLVTPQEQVSDLKQAILEVFCRADVRGKLLILGAPGAGKTTTLLTLAKELLTEAFTTPGTTIPVIFELSTWTPNQSSLRDWLIAQLKDLYNLQPKESAQWLEDELLLPLLDGLDELGMEQQQRCIAAINTFA
ncbi:MAG TPA: NACHT domain-containing protein, partial [Crinalium sp.]